MRYGVLLGKATRIFQFLPEVIGGVNGNRKAEVAQGVMGNLE